MKNFEHKRTQVADLLRAYAIAASAHGAAVSNGDHRAANKQHDIVAEVYRELRLRGVETQRCVLGLLDHPDESVRGWAAAHALEFAPAEGRTVLENIAQGAGMRSFAAATTLKEWEKGTLSFP